MPFQSCFHVQSDNDLHCPMIVTLNSLPNAKILDVTKLKAFADDKINVAQMTISVFDMVDNIAGKGENAGNQHFLLFPQCFLANQREVASLEIH